MATRLGRVGMGTLAGTMAAVPVAAACQLGPTYDQWAATDGAAGRINLDDVQEAFKRSRSATDFEQRVNQIYEGDGLVLIQAKQDGEKLVLEGWENLDKNNQIDADTDDLLFTIVNDHDNNELRGHGANGYYNSGFGGGGFLLGYMVASSFARPGYYYHSPNTLTDRGRSIRQRNSYRNSARYRSQVSRNSKHFTQQKKFAGTRYNQPRSSSRQRYMSSAQKSGTYKASSTGVRSSWGSSSRAGGTGGRRGGGFRGYGGGQVIIGAARQ